MPIVAVMGLYIVARTDLLLCSLVARMSELNTFSFRQPSISRLVVPCERTRKIVRRELLLYYANETYPVNSVIITAHQRSSLTPSRQAKPASQYAVITINLR